MPARLDRRKNTGEVTADIGRDLAAWMIHNENNSIPCRKRSNRSAVQVFRPPLTYGCSSKEVESGGESAKLCGMPGAFYSFCVGRRVIKASPIALFGVGWLARKKAAIWRGEYASGIACEMAFCPATGAPRSLSDRLAGMAQDE